jgi:hypothetical protein
MSAQVGTLQRTGFPRMMWPALAIAVVLVVGIGTVAVVTNDRTNTQTSTASAAVTAQTDRLTAIAGAFEGSTRSVTADAARWTAAAESSRSTGVVLGVTTPTELRLGPDGSTTEPTDANGPIGFHPLP